MQDFLKKQYRKLISIAWNTGAFVISICTQQLIIMPFLGRRFSEHVYSQAALFLTIFNIVVCVVGDELGNTYLVRKTEYDKTHLRGDFFPILAGITGFLFVGEIVLNVFITNFNALLVAAYTVTFSCGILRYFLFGYLKGDLRFRMIFYANGVYALGALLGIVLLPEGGSYILPFFCGEMPSALFTLGAVLHYCRNDIAWKCTPQFGKTAKDFARLSLSALLINGVAYLDRLLVYPQLGAMAMSIYYSSTTMSKLTSMITNPISGVLLAQLSNKNQEEFRVYANAALVSWPIFVGIMLVFNLAFTPLALKYLYSQFFTSAMQLLVPISIAGALSGANYLIKPAILKLYSTNFFLFINLTYAIFFIGTIYYSSNRWGLKGYAVTSVIAYAIQSVCYLSALYKKCKEVKYGK